MEYFLLHIMYVGGVITLKILTSAFNISFEMEH